MISKFIFLSILSLLFLLFDFYVHKRFIPFFTQNIKIKKNIIFVLVLWEFGFVILSVSNFLWGIRPFFAVVLGVLLFVVTLGLILEILCRLPYFDKTKYIFSAIFIFFFFFSLYGASLPPKIKHININTDSQKLKGLRFAVMADAHIDPSKQEFAVAIVKQINAIHADAILIVGDLCDGNIKDVQQSLLPFKELRSKYGVFFSPGNHEYYYNDFDEKMNFLHKLGFRTLINQSEEINGLSIVGISDPAAARVSKEEPNASKAFKGAIHPSILLAHQPKTAVDSLQFSPEIIFCGHTHNGQIWPFKYLVSLAQPFVYGEYSRGKSKIEVTSGAGLWGPPMRLFSRSEILVVTFF